MKPIEIITDGSYVDGKVGVGYVRIKSIKFNGGCDFTADSDLLELSKKSPYGSQAAEAAAVIFALNSLDAEGYTGDVVIYCDLIDLVKYINGYKNRVDDSIQPVFDELDNCISRHNSVRSMHPKHAEQIPKFLCAIAHNASAMESGAKKREKTTPHYNGKYASNINTEDRNSKQAKAKRRLRPTPV